MANRVDAFVKPVKAPLPGTPAYGLGAQSTGTKLVEIKDTLELRRESGDLQFPSSEA